MFLLLKVFKNVTLIAGKEITFLSLIKCPYPPVFRLRFFFGLFVFVWFFFLVEGQGGGGVN